MSWYMITDPLMQRPFAYIVTVVFQQVIRDKRHGRLALDLGVSVFLPIRVCIRSIIVPYE